MNWKYFIPHFWEEERTLWEDIYLMPLKGELKETLWLSVNAPNFIAEPNRNVEDQPELVKQILARLENNSHVMSPTINGEMYINLPDFNQSELLEYAKIYLNELGYEVNALIEGSYEEFEEKIKRLRT